MKQHILLTIASPVISPITINTKGINPQINAIKTKFIITAVVVCLKRELKYIPLLHMKKTNQTTNNIVNGIATGWMNSKKEKNKTCPSN